MGGILSQAPIRRLACCLISCFIGFQIAPVRAEAVDPSAPTADHTSPEVREQQWRAAQSKYDGKRHEWLDRVVAGESSGPFRADWSSLRQYRAPAWYANARFGIFIHWGLYSVAGFGNEWY
jgi:alpha-L-fucosidase